MRISSVSNSGSSIAANCPPRFNIAIAIAPAAEFFNDPRGQFCQGGVVGFLENVPERDVGEMNGHDAIGVTARKLFCDGAVPVSRRAPQIQIVLNFALRSKPSGSAYVCLDLTPKGRNETGPGFNLGDWVRHHDRYDDDDATS